MTPRIAAALALGALACGSPTEPIPMTDAALPRDSGVGVDLGTSEADLGTGIGRYEIVGGDWEMAGGSEGYVCVRQTITETVYVRAFEPIAPEGTHHTVVTVERDPLSPDGISTCAAFTNAPDMIYGSGVGTEPLELPDGVAVEIPAGAQILLNLHLFNVGAELLTGHSGLIVETVEEADVEEVAQVLLAGNESFVIPPSTADHWVEGSCTARAATTIFAVSPHMHQYGDYMEVSATIGGESQLLLEQTYTFDDQRYTMLGAPVQLAEGDTIDVRCRYQNPTSDQVTFGDSSLQEMCYGGIFHYPPLPNGSITCSR
jgi:hypothetical protein